MPSYRVEVPTGPSGVHEIFEKLSKSFIQGVEEGTEAVYFPIDATDQVDAIKSGQDLVRGVFGAATGLARGVKAYRRVW